MNELVSLETLANVKDAAASEVVGQLFGVVREAVPENDGVDLVDLMPGSAVATNELRDDVAIESTASERQIMIDNFPLSKNNYLIVPKVIEE